MIHPVYNFQEGKTIPSDFTVKGDEFDVRIELPGTYHFPAVPSNGMTPSQKYRHFRVMDGRVTVADSTVGNKWMQGHSYELVHIRSFTFHADKPVKLRFGVAEVLGNGGGPGGGGETPTNPE